MEAKGTLFEKQVQQRRVGEQDIGQVGTMQHFIIRLGRAIEDTDKLCCNKEACLSITSIIDNLLNMHVACKYF